MKRFDSIVHMNIRLLIPRLGFDAIFISSHSMHEIERVHDSSSSTVNVCRPLGFLIASLNVGVQLLLCALLIITLSRNADTQSVWNALDALLPDLLVELWVEANVSGAHLLKSKLLDLLDRAWGSLLERNTVHLNNN